MLNSKNVKNGTIIKQDLSKGNFVQTSKSILTNKSLSDSAVRLLQLMVDTPSSTKISLTYYRELLGWSKDKLSNATKNLVENGYLKITQYPKGVGYTYVYTISEYGNLNIVTDETGEIIKIAGAVKPYSKKLPVTTKNPKELATASEIDESKIQLFSELLETYGELANVPEFESLITKNITNDFNIEGLMTDAEKFLKEFYNTEIKKIKSPEHNKRAFEATKEWLKDQVFNKFNVKPYSEQARDIETKYLMFTMKHPAKQKIDRETELLERTND